MKRTTLTLDDDLFVEIKRSAASQGKPMAALVNDLLRHAVAGRPRRKAFRLELEGWDAALQPGVDIADRDKLITGDRDFTRFAALSVQNPFS